MTARKAKIVPSGFLFTTQGTYLASPKNYYRGTLKTREGVNIPASLEKNYLEIPVKSHSFTAIPTIDIDGLILNLILSQKKSDVPLDKIQFSGAIVSLSSESRVTVLSDISQISMRIKLPGVNVLEIKNTKGIFYFTRQENKFVFNSFEPEIPPVKKKAKEDIKDRAEKDSQKGKSKKAKRKKTTKQDKQEKDKLSKEERIRQNLERIRITPESNTIPGKHKRAWHIR